MIFATPADLLARGSANRIAQLACPTDMPMPPEASVRSVLEGGDVAGFPADDRPALAAALETVTQALGDADSLILSYGVPDTAVTPLVKRLATTAALYYLQGAERMTQELQRMYDAVLTTLKAHSRGELNLVPADPTAPPVSDDLVVIDSAPRRFGGIATGGYSFED